MLSTPASMSDDLKGNNTAWRQNVTTHGEYLQQTMRLRQRMAENNLPGGKLDLLYMVPERLL